jgi:predicted nucleic-acid-binding protein
MPRGGFRPGSGRKPRDLTPAKEIAAPLPPDVVKAARKNKMTPLEYMEAVINDLTATVERRDRMAQAAAPYRHARADAVVAAKGVKEQRNDQAKEIGVGKYATPSAPPRMVVNNA